MEDRRASDNQGLASRWLNMSYVIAAPEMMASAATDLATIGSNLSAVHTAAAASTAGLIPAAADEVSTGIAHLFSQHAMDFQAAAAQAAVFHEQFTQHLTAGASSYAGIEAVIARLLQSAGQSLQSLLPSPGSFWGGLLTLFEQQPIQFIIGTLVYLPLEVLALIIFWPVLLLGAILAGA
jgi:hypothetical protein